MHPCSRMLARKNVPASASHVPHVTGAVGTWMLPGIPVQASQGHQPHVPAVPKSRRYGWTHPPGVPLLERIPRPPGKLALSISVHCRHRRLQCLTNHRIQLRPTVRATPSGPEREDGDPEERRGGLPAILPDDRRHPISQVGRGESPPGRGASCLNCRRSHPLVKSNAV